MEEMEVIKGMVVKILDEIVNIKATIAAIQDVLVVHDVCDSEELEVLEDANKDGLLSSMEHMDLMS